MSTSNADRAEAITIVTFRLKPQQSVERFLKLSGDLVAWLHGRDGFCRYELFRTGDSWTDTMTWTNAEAAAAGNTTFMQTDLAHELVAMVEPNYRSFTGERVLLELQEVNP